MFIKCSLYSLRTACVYWVRLVFMSSGVCSFGMAYMYYAQLMCIRQDLKSGTAYVHQVRPIVVKDGLYV